MKKIVLSVIVALIAITANAQVYVGGTFGVGSDKVETEGTEVRNTTFKILPEVGYELSEDWSVGTVVGYEYNKSGGGIRLQSKKKYQKDDYMMLDFDLDIDGSISHKSIIGKVVESRANDNDGTLFANRLQFVDIDRLDREEIIKYIFGQQRNILKKELSSNG